MDGLELVTFTAQETLHMHEATGVVRDDVIRVGGLGVRAFHFTHGRGDHGELGREGAAEAAAGLSVLHLDEFKAFHLLQELTRGGFDAEFAETVAAIVEGDFGRELGSEIGDTEFLHEEIGELPDLAGEFIRSGGFGFVLEELGIKDLEHRTTGTRGDDDGLSVLQALEGGLGDATGFIPVTGVEGGLAAAGDLFGAFDTVAEFFKDADHVDPDLREQRIHETRHKQSHSHRNWVRMRWEWGWVNYGNGENLTADEGEEEPRNTLNTRMETRDVMW